MDPMNIEDIVKRQGELARRVRKQIESAKKAEDEKPERAIRNHDGRLAAARAELDAAISARDAALRRYDQDIARKREEVATLGRELDEMKQAVDAGKNQAAATRGEARPERKGSPSSRFGVKKDGKKQSEH